MSQESTKKPSKSRKTADKEQQTTPAAPASQASSDSPEANGFFAGLDDYIHSSAPAAAPEATAAEPMPVDHAVDDEPSEGHSSGDGLIVPGIGSPALQQIERSRRPDPSTICETCPASLWFVSPDRVRCYCRIMHLVVWSTDEPNVLTNCDGPSIASQE